MGARFFCIARQRHECNGRHLPLDLVEAAVEQHFDDLRLAPELVAHVRAELAATLADSQAASREVVRQAQARLAKLDVQEENLLDLVADGDVSSGRAKARLQRISAERAQLAGQIGQTDEQLELGAQVIRRTVELLEAPGVLYRSSSPQGRRLICQAIFDKLYLDDITVSDDQLHEPFAGFVDLDRSLYALTATRTDTSAEATIAQKRAVEPALQELSDRLWPETNTGRSACSCRRPASETKTGLLAAALAGGSS